jgi:hypothetical protein
MHLGELRKPLRVTFLGGEHGNIKEEAVDEGSMSFRWTVFGHLRCGVPSLHAARTSLCDTCWSAGGVSKEFFQLLVREIFSPAYG